jgi:hypothetical protein
MGGMIMGASEFFTTSSGENVLVAFRSAVEEAEYEYGHGGYTGTIAEKSEYKSASSEVFESREAATEFATQKMDDPEHWCNDKWGPAAYVSFKSKDSKVKFLFFGRASD